MYTQKKLQMHLRELIGNAIQGQRLAPEREIAKEFGVSPVTVRRALKPFIAEGLITRIPGKGTIIGPLPELPTAHLASTQGAVEQVEGHLISALSRGTLKQGHHLPLIKTLAHQLSVSPRTVSSAYNNLSRKGLVFRTGQRYCAGQFDAKLHTAAPGTIYIIKFGDPDLSSMYRTSRLSLAYQRMEWELLHHHYSLQYSLANKLPHLISSWRTSRAFPSGVLLIEPDEKEFSVACERLIPVAREAGKGRCTLLATSVASQSPPPEMKLVCFGNIDTTVSRTLATYISQCEIKKVCLIYNGGRSSFISHIKLKGEIAQRNKSVTFDMLSIIDNQSTPEGFFDYLYQKYPNGRLKSILSKYAFMTPEQLTQNLIFSHSIEQALYHCNDADLIIFSRNSDAAAALHILRRSGKKIPEQGMIISTEDDPALRTEGISTCVEDWDTTGYLMAHVLIGDIPIARTRRGYVRTQAVMLHRGTTRI